MKLLFCYIIIIKTIQLHAILIFPFILLKEQLNEPCKRGCRLYSIHDATRSVDPFFASFNLRQIGWNNHEDGTFSKCSKGIFKIKFQIL